MDRVVRILDANLNRANEALRVIEEACRFLLDDGTLSLACKGLRHGLSSAARRALPTSSRLREREVEGDVGRDLRVRDQEEARDPGQAVEANFKRLQEALRSVEEYAGARKDLRRTAEACRYEVYGIERAILGRLCGGDRARAAHLYVVLTSEVAGTSLREAAHRALVGGAQMLQLREKTMGGRRLVEGTRRVLALARPRGVAVLVDDRCDIALAAAADGVHVGREDLSVKDARRLLGPAAIVGATAHSPEEARKAERDGASYVSAGPVFSAATKWRHLPEGEKPRLDPRGLSIVRAITRAVKCPVFAIGGITPANLPQVLAAGATRVAVCAGILAAPDPVAAARRMRRLIDRSLKRPAR